MEKWKEARKGLYLIYTCLFLCIFSFFHLSIHFPFPSVPISSVLHEFLSHPCAFPHLSHSLPFSCFDFKSNYRSATACPTFTCPCFLRAIWIEVGSRSSSRGPGVYCAWHCTNAQQKVPDGYSSQWFPHKEGFNLGLSALIANTWAIRVTLLTTGNNWLLILTD